MNCPIGNIKILHKNKTILQVCDSMYKCVTFKYAFAKQGWWGPQQSKVFEYLFNVSMKQLFAQLKNFKSNAFLKSNLIILGLIKA